MQRSRSETPLMKPSPYYNFQRITRYALALLCLSLNEGALSLSISNVKHVTRRTFLTREVTDKMLTIIGISTAATTFVPLEAQSIEEYAGSADGNVSTNRPYAPPSALLPAVRLKTWTDKAYNLASSLPSADKEHRYKYLSELNEILSSPPKLFITEKPLKRTSSSLAQITSSVSSANKDQYQLNRKGLNNISDKFSAMLNQADVERQWGMLQYAESQREQSNEMRAAFNYYTQQLNFGDKYVLTASKQDRKKMIREDNIPSLTSVITSDLDLRDLYRNQYLTAIEDVTAEVGYQVKLGGVDVSDTVDLMTQAYNAISQWFDMISSEDIEEAIASVNAK